jgi:UDP-N-acetylmuramoyl-tripeptide--D-alanyl-D-alanine ligase
LQPFIDKTPGVTPYNSHGLQDWTVSNVVLTPTSTSFTLKHGKKVLKLTSGLLGRHQVGPISLAAILGIQLGLTDQQIVDGVAKTTPFEHRMQSRQLGGAWIIDDTYNGNIEGIRAGTELLAALEAKRKIYVTPGLVDQGKQKQLVHTQLGELVAKAKPDKVVLMKNSATRYIQQGLQTGDYQGEVTVEADPLAFYTNLEHFVAAGDVVLMQNDWTDNYA